MGPSPMARERLRKAVSDLTLEKLILRGEAQGRTPRETVSSPARRRRYVERVMAKLGGPPRGRHRSEARGGRASGLARVLGQHRSTRRKAPKRRADEAALTAGIIALAAQYGRYGYRRSCHWSAIGPSDNGEAMLHAAGWAADVKRVERIRAGRGSKCRVSSRRKAVSGSTTDRASARGRNVPTTSGASRLRRGSDP